MEKVSFSENNSGEKAGILCLSPEVYVSEQPNRDIVSNQMNQLGQHPKLPEGFPGPSLCDTYYSLQKSGEGKNRGDRKGLRKGISQSFRSVRQAVVHAE